MAGTVNKVILIGNLGAKPEIRNTQSGAKVATLSIATTESWKDQAGNKQSRTEWHRVVVWGDGLVGVIEQYVNKGDKVYVEGQLRNRKWQDQQGQDRYTTEVVISGFGGSFTMLSSSNNQNNGATNPNGYQPDATGQTQPQGQDPNADMTGLDDDIPF